jgi:hypothetical protein
MLTIKHSAKKIDKLYFKRINYSNSIKKIVTWNSESYREEYDTGYKTMDVVY